MSEITFLLIKPDAATSHQYIIDAITSAGFAVLDRSYLLTATMADVLVTTFPSVQRRLHIDSCKSVNNNNNSGEGYVGSPNSCNNSLAASASASHSSPRRAATKTLLSSSPVRNRAIAAAAANNNFVLGESSAHNHHNHHNHKDGGGGRSYDVWSAVALERRRRERANHSRISLEIWRMSSHHHGAETGVNAGLPTAATTSSATEAYGSNNNINTSMMEDAALLLNAAGGSTTTTSSTTHNNNNVMPLTTRSGSGLQPQQQQREATSSAALHIKAIESMSAPQLIEAHLHHLCGGGTCLSLVLAGCNAVERLVQLLGPDDPRVAATNAPRSLRARLGKHVVCNALHAPATFAEVGVCLAAVFGHPFSFYLGRMTSAGGGGGGVSPTATPVGTTAHRGPAVVAANLSLLPCSVAVRRDGGDGGDGLQRVMEDVPMPVHLPDVLPRLVIPPNRHLSYYIR